MRHTNFAVLLIIIACFFIGCTSNVSKDWQTVSINGSGTLSIPSNWQCYEEKDYIYIVDSNDIPLMVQSYSFAGVGNNQEGIMESNKYIDNIQCIKCLTSSGLSNGAIYGEMLISYDGEQRKVFYIDITDDVSMQLLILDKSLDEEIVRKIAESYVDPG